MLNIKEIVKVLQSYNMNIRTYGPSIYAFGDETGICLEVKDTTFGFLLRYFTFKTKDELENFLKKYTWYKKNHKKYNINLSLDKYDIPNPNIKYTYNSEELEFDDMINFEHNIINKTQSEAEENEKMSYLINIENITNYFLKLEQQYSQIREEKNKLKIEENELKYTLLENLTTYYDKEKNITKKPVNLDIIIQNNDNTLLNTLDEVRVKPLEDIKNYLKELINKTKNLELDDKHIIDEYSCLVYKYNIDILKKQIDFVKRKIETEKNFNIKGSKNHNIDEELKSFLKVSKAPDNIKIYQERIKNEINQKYNNIEDIRNAYTLVSGKEINLPIIKEKTTKKSDVVTNLKDQFDYLDKKEQALLVLYNSFYKEICEELDNKSIDDLKETINSSYHEMESIAFNESNNHYLANYFKYINFKTEETYISSLKEIKNTVNKTRLILIDNLKVFCVEQKNNKEFLSIDPIFSKKDKIYLVNLLKGTKLLYIPDKIIIDNNRELNIISTKNIYIDGDIIDECDSIIVNKYQKVSSKESKDITTINELALKNSYIFNIGTIEV